jgi:hypothetical protein
MFESLVYGLHMLFWLPEWMTWLLNDLGLSKYIPKPTTKPPDVVPKPPRFFRARSSGEDHLDSAVGYVPIFQSKSKSLSLCPPGLSSDRKLTPV